MAVPGHWKPGCTPLPGHAFLSHVGSCCSRGLGHLSFHLSEPLLSHVETSAEPSLQAKQLKLKRARLADDLNEKIAQRPGPMELVEKNILPVESSLKEALIGEESPTRGLSVGERQVKGEL